MSAVPGALGVTCALGHGQRAAEPEPSGDLCSAKKPGGAQASRLNRPTLGQATSLPCEPAGPPARSENPGK
jgi:hypothetical protein